MHLARRLVTLGALCCLLMSLAALKPAQAADDGPDGEAIGERPSGGGGGFISMLLSPLRATVAQARRLFGRPLGGARDAVAGAHEMVADGFNQIQLQTFRMFMSLYNKTYAPEEIPRRMALFFERRRAIEESVRDFAAGKVAFVMRENLFTDWDEMELKGLAGVSPPKSFEEMTAEERAAVMEMRRQDGDVSETTTTMTTTAAAVTTTQAEQQAPLELVNPDGDKPISVARSLGDAIGGNAIDDDADDDVHDADDDDDDPRLMVRAGERIPASKDWRASGCVSTPINQMKCGACYAIATMSVVESMRCINQVSSPILAPQQVVDCATVRAGYQNHGCDGGWPTRVLKYLQDVRVAARESCYPFVRRQGQCRLSSVRAVAGCTVSANPAADSSSSSSLRYKVLNNERDILYHVARTGPVVTVMRATDKFLYYGSGIFDDPKCTRRRDDVDHAIVITGYGRENGQDYWLIKNSWGTSDWGEGGYGKYKRGTNACSIGHWGWVITG